MEWACIISLYIYYVAFCMSCYTSPGRTQHYVWAMKTSSQVGKSAIDSGGSFVKLKPKSGLLQDVALSCCDKPVGFYANLLAVV